MQLSGDCSFVTTILAVDAVYHVKCHWHVCMMLEVTAVNVTADIATENLLAELDDLHMMIKHCMGIDISDEEYVDGLSLSLQLSVGIENRYANSV